MAIDYKSKYIDLRSKFSKSCDRYYRMGYEEGMKEGQQQAMQDQMAMQQQQAAMEQGIDPETGMPIEGGQDGVSPEEQQMMGGEGEVDPQEMNMEDGGSELDQHINELESLVQKGEKPKVTDLRKAIKALTDLRKSKTKLKSNHKAVTVSKQKDLVNNILQKWEEEANQPSVTANLEKIIAAEGIKIE